MVQIWVDADACPVKEEIFKVAFRHNAQVSLVSNQWLRVPRHELVKMIVVDDKFDAADDHIANNVTDSSIVITNDILLADRCLKSHNPTVLKPNGKPFTKDNVGSAVATRAIMADLRAGAEQSNIGGPPPFSKKDRSSFLQALDLACVQMMKRR